MSDDVKAMCEELVGERLDDLTSDRWAVAFAAYLAGLKARYASDPAMAAAYVDDAEALLNGREVTAP